MTLPHYTLTRCGFETSCFQESVFIVTLDEIPLTLYYSITTLYLYTYVCISTLYMCASCPAPTNYGFQYMTSRYLVAPCSRPTPLPFTLFDLFHSIFFKAPPISCFRARKAAKSLWDSFILQDNATNLPG